DYKLELVFIKKLPRRRGIYSKAYLCIRGFKWPPSSPNLNPIEKVWRWMKEELKKLGYMPKSIEDLKREL
ncbi:hypothetical protein L207DRAFT_515315, partial [Hyaloscypha variabilis F]